MPQGRPTGCTCPGILVAKRSCLTILLSERRAACPSHLNLLSSSCILYDYYYTMCPWICLHASVPCFLFAFVCFLVLPGFRFRSTSYLSSAVGCVCATALPDCNVYWLSPSPAFPFPDADYGGYVILHTAHHTIITTDHGCRYTNLLADSQAVFVCCTMQVSYGVFGVGVCR